MHDRIHTKKRASMSPKQLNRWVCAYCNLRLLRKLTSKEVEVDCPDFDVRSVDSDDPEQMSGAE